MIPSSFQDYFSVPKPLQFAGEASAIVFEIKPYLQPFEQKLALLELRALLNPDDEIYAMHGYWVANTSVSEELLRDKLTYWQRLGCDSLKITHQTALEFTQSNGAISKKKLVLHRARRLRYGPHDLHEYRGKFFPQLVRSLINISGIPEGSVVLDPMSGSGTTACESVAAGMSAIGADMNPLSVLIASIKALIPSLDPKDFKRQTTTCLSKLKFKPSEPTQIWNEADLAYMGKWFDTDAIKDLASIISSVGKIQSKTYRDFFLVCLSNIVRSVSWQKSTDLRVRKEVVPYEAGMAQFRFLAEAKAQIDRIYPYLSIIKRHNPVNIKIRQGNALEITSVFSEYKGNVDLLVSSPPYATALPYLDTDRLSLIVLGLLPRKQHGKVERCMVGTREISERERCEAWTIYKGRRAELPEEICNIIDKIAIANHMGDVGFRKRNLPALLGKYFLSMLDAMRSARELMKPGALGYYVVGNNSTTINGQKIEIPTNHFIMTIGKAAGWTPQEQISMELLSSRDIFRENRGSSETIISFRA